MTARQKKKQMKRIQANQTYENYVQQYETRRKNLAKQGLRMDMSKYTFEEWKNQKKLMEAETDAVDINKLLVDRGAYARTDTLARKYKKALAERGIETTVREIRLKSTYATETYIDQLLADIEEVSMDLAADGKTGKQRQKIIGAMFFGSV